MATAIIILISVVMLISQFQQNICLVKCPHITLVNHYTFQIHCLEILFFCHASRHAGC